MLGNFREMLTNDKLEAAPGMSRKTIISVGICATGKAENLPSLLDMVRSEVSIDFEICKIIVVASGCRDLAISHIRRLSLRDPRFVIIEEDKRYGKAEAINKILEQREGDYLIFINSDALPKSGAIGELFHHIKSKPNVGVVSASPFFDASGDLGMNTLEELIWSIHNESSLTLNHLGLSNHSSDEMMIVRASLLERLPRDLVNDGSFIASKIKQHGFSIGFSKAAKVRISVPNRVVDLIDQRRRILFGHLQVRRLVGKTPLTVESLLVYSPGLSLNILTRTIARRPRLLFAFPLAIITEGISTVLALIDLSRSSKRHAVWKRYDN
jgi:cellulose synthase/poly-beta-1,6-N-acetylglucosamine synthase-like glycosyltransferase